MENVEKRSSFLKHGSKCYFEKECLLTYNCKKNFARNYTRNKIPSLSNPSNLTHLSKQSNFTQLSNLSTYRLSEKLYIPVTSNPSTCLINLICPFNRLSIYLPPFLPGYISIVCQLAAIYIARYIWSKHKSTPEIYNLCTPWKINMEPTNHQVRKENDLPNLHDYVPC